MFEKAVLSLSLQLHLAQAWQATCMASACHTCIAAAQQLTGQATLYDPHSKGDHLLGLQAVHQALWDAAISLYHKTSRDEASMWRAWQWMHLKGLSWAPSDPACYVSIAHAVTAQGNPQEGESLCHPLC